jgi:hypothetical protein
MRLVAKTMEKVIVEITANELEEQGFDYNWDKIRRTYKAKDYEVDFIGSHGDNKQLIFIELISKKPKG